MPCSSVRMSWTQWPPGIVLNVIYRSELKRSMTLKIGKIFEKVYDIKNLKVNYNKVNYELSIILKIRNKSEDIKT